MKSVIKRPRHRSNRPHRPQSGENNHMVMTSDMEHDERLDYRPPRNRSMLQQNIDKYLNQAREAMSSGDRVAAENFLQHADHFNRLLNEQKEVRQQFDQKKPQRDADHSTTVTETQNKAPVGEKPVEVLAEESVEK